MASSCRDMRSWGQGWGAGRHLSWEPLLVAQQDGFQKCSSLGSNIWAITALTLASPSAGGQGWARAVFQGLSSIEKLIKVTEPLPGRMPTCAGAAIQSGRARFREFRRTLGPRQGPRARECCSCLWGQLALYPALDAATVADIPHTLLGARWLTAFSRCSSWPARSKPLSPLFR